MINNTNLDTNYLTQYINYLGQQNKSSNTINSYYKDINSFFEHFNLSPTTITRDQIITYRQFLQNTKNINAKSINRALSAIKSYNEYLIREGYQENLVVLSMDYIKVQKPLLSPTNTTTKQAINFKNRVKNNECPRNYYIVSLLLNTGLRISEALNIELDDINFKKKNLRVIGKGSKQRIIPLNEEAIEIIKKAIEDRNNYKYAINMNSNYLFLSKKGGKLESATVERIFNKHSNIITPHVCRHIFATNYLENGGNVRELQYILGHSRLDTTGIYLNPSEISMNRNINNSCIR